MPLSHERFNIIRTQGKLKNYKNTRKTKNNRNTTVTKINYIKKPCLL